MVYYRTIVEYYLSHNEVSSNNCMNNIVFYVECLNIELLAIWRVVSVTYLFTFLRCS